MLYGTGLVIECELIVVEMFVNKNIHIEVGHNSTSCETDRSD